MTRPRARILVEGFLASAGLSLDAALQSVVGIFDQDDALKGCAGLDGDVIKCMALADELRGEGIAGSLVTELMNRAFSEGFSNVKVFTKPEYEGLFADMGFTLCGRASRAVMLESDSSSLCRYKEYLSGLDCDGVIVANANPCTLGHLYLIEQAASRVRRLAVIPVAEHASNMFRYEERVGMLRAATAHLPNVVVAEGSHYSVSSATFPSYFIKEMSSVAEAQAELDIDIFMRHLAPALGTGVRFVGTEPSDALTRGYNVVMKRMLPLQGIRVEEIERKRSGILAISASEVRRLLAQGNLFDALRLVPASDLPRFLSSLALRALRMELELAPKPGLVDPYDSGSHKDMDYGIMMNGIESLRPYFTELAASAMVHDTLSAETLKEIGMRGEQMMFAATGGINTHKGAVFSLGLAVSAVVRILCGHSRFPLPEEIAALASGLDYARDTHGRQVRERSGLPGAMDYARAGYTNLFSSWLPFYESGDDDDVHRLKLLLRIISEIDDSNAVYRSGLEMAEMAKSRARALLEDFSIEGLNMLNDEFKRCNMSHGGAADMLSLTFFISSVRTACEAALADNMVLNF